MIDNETSFTDKTAFLFLIRSSKKYKAQIFDLIDKYDRCAVYDCADYEYGMIAFGGGWDIGIYENCNINPHSYVSKRTYAVKSPYYLNGNEMYFKVKEIEIFTIE